MQKRICLFLSVVLLGFFSQGNCFNLFNSQPNEEKEIISILHNHARAMNKHDIEKVKKFYSKDYKSADNFDLNTLTTMLEKTYDDYKNIKYKINVVDVEYTDTEAKAVVVDSTKAKVQSTQNKKRGQAGLLEGKSEWSVNFRKENGEWKILSDEIKSEETSLKYGIAKKVGIDLQTPEKIKNGEIYDLKLQLDVPENIEVLASISREEIVYPPKTSEDKFRKVPETGLLERLVRANKNNLNEYAIASIGLTEVSLDEKEIKATIQVKGVAYVMKRVNMEKMGKNAKK